jgi:murein DD-endopeptidase MepM/ murein hydrolase activator NlpD
MSLRISSALISAISPPPVNKLFGPLLRMELRVDHPLSPESAVKQHTLAGGTFGKHVRNQGRRPHQGIDLVAEIGTPVYAVAPGKIEWILPHNGAYGCCMLQSFRWFDGRLYYAFFAHLSGTYVREGEEVRPQMHGIARTGISGMPAKTHPHLHFEIRYLPDRHLGKDAMHGRVDPLRFLGSIPMQRSTMDYLMQHQDSTSRTA